jgi:2-dehydro-3-deoxygluconokinase
MQIVTVGEGMIELSRAADGSGWRVGYGGDTLNTALHLARLGRHVAFLSAIGDDPFSRDLRADWAREGLDTRWVLTDPSRRAGLYAITNDQQGERHFPYWRGESAARRMFDLPDSEAAAMQASGAALLLFSMISLAILPPPARERLIALAHEVRARGGRVAFDTNYRPALWPDLAAARAAHRAAMAVADIGLPTIEDEAALTGLDDPAAIERHWHEAGVTEVALKMGGEGCRVGGVSIAPPQRLTPRDTSGAGDAFNAGYLHARLAGLAPAEAAAAGHAMAGWVVMNMGAVPPLDATAPYRRLGELAAAG